MSRLRPPRMPPHLEERYRKSLPPGARPTPPKDLQIQNWPEEEPEHRYPRWDLLLEYWNEVPE